MNEKDARPPRIWRRPYAVFGDEARWDDDRSDEIVRADGVYTLVFMSFSKGGE